MQENLIQQDRAIEFILGGNALFTVKSKKTDNRFTYKVLRDRNQEEYFKVFVLNGKDNTKDYKRIGSIETKDFMHTFCGFSRSNDAAIAFDHIFLNLLIHLEMPSLQIWHEGRCCRCGRVLTVPESIVAGIGPECAFK